MLEIEFEVELPNTAPVAALGGLIAESTHEDLLTALRGDADTSTNSLRGHSGPFFSVVWLVGGIDCADFFFFFFFFFFSPPSYYLSQRPSGK
jgi:hypothetical protein